LSNYALCEEGSLWETGAIMTQWDDDHMWFHVAFVDGGRLYYVVNKAALPPNVWAGASALKFSLHRTGSAEWSAGECTLSLAGTPHTLYPAVDDLSVMTVPFSLAPSAEYFIIRFDHQDYAAPRHYPVCGYPSETKLFSHYDPYHFLILYGVPGTYTVAFAGGAAYGVVICAHPEGSPYFYPLYIAKSCPAVSSDLPPGVSASNLLAQPPDV